VRDHLTETKKLMGLLSTKIIKLKILPYVAVFTFQLRQLLQTDPKPKKFFMQNIYKPSQDTCFIIYATQPHHDRYLSGIFQLGKKAGSEGNYTNIDIGTMVKEK
jgi:hypothetical protein